MDLRIKIVIRDVQPHDSIPEKPETRDVFLKKSRTKFLETGWTPFSSKNTYSSLDIRDNKLNPTVVISHFQFSAFIWRETTPTRNLIVGRKRIFMVSLCLSSGPTSEFRL